MLIVLGAAGYVLVRNSLRPLAEVERTAQAIAAGDLSQRVPAGDDAHRGRAVVHGLERDAVPHRARVPRAAGLRGGARASEERLRRFVADASHELRTPLTSIRGFAELYRQGAVGTEDDVRRLMRGSRPRAAVWACWSRTCCSSRGWTRSARSPSRRSISPRSPATPSTTPVPSSPTGPSRCSLDESLTDVPVVLGDEGRLRQVVGNLLTNALVHTPGDTRVTVTVAEAADDPGTLVVTVADEGPGMDPADAARVFERFYRADASRTRSAGGTGLGLSIVASLVAAHGGSVGLDTAPGRGATVIVRLPRSGPVLAPSDGGGARTV